MLYPCLIELPEYREEERGALAVAQYPEQVPFLIRRIFHMYDLPKGGQRGGHAHVKCHQFILCPHGALHAAVGSLSEERVFVLDSPRKGLYLPPLFRVELTALVAGSVCQVLASDPYDPGDYC